MNPQQPRNKPLDAALDGAVNALGGSKAFSLPRPKDDDELHEAVVKYFGINIPRNSVCKDHRAPFDAFADAFFARSVVSVWKASRGFGGKSLLLALLGLCESVFLGAKCNILGGSGEQSQRVLNYINGEEMPEAFWGCENAPIHLVVGGVESETPDNAKGITKKMIKLTNGGYLKALMASSRSVRGPHPQRLRMDEADEMELAILDSALGQPMARLGIDEQTVISSTHQYSNGTMTEMLKRASQNGWPVFEWCYKENHVDNDGWLEQGAIDRKKQTVTAVMWKTEYENQEPNPEGRAIDVEKCELAFQEVYLGKSGFYAGDPFEDIVLEEPYRGGEPELSCHRCKHPYRRSDTRASVCTHCLVQRRLTRPGTYATGTDWAKKKDWTIIHTIRTDVTPARLVAWGRYGRIDWPAIIKKHEDRIRKYGGGAAHDITGLGSVIDDYLNVASDGVLMQGLPRHEMLSQYITAIEAGRIIFPRIKFMFDEHRLSSVEDVFRSGETFHLPDSMAAGALAWKASGMGSVGEIFIPMLDSAGKVVVMGSRDAYEQSRKAPIDSFRGPMHSGGYFA